MVIFFIFVCSLADQKIINTIPSMHVPIKQARQDFPILSQEINGNPLIYFDNAATTQKPQVVIDALVNYYTRINSNIHRGAHHLAEKATAAYEETRQTIQSFIHAKHSEEIIFTKSTTEAINLVAHGWGRKFLQKNDEILISAMEHHADIVPWHILAEEKGIRVKIIPINDKGEIELDEYQKLLSPKTKLVCINHVSNTLGTINPIKQIIDWAHEVKAHALIDGAQAVAHLDVDVEELNCDFYTFSAHKLYGPTGVGVLYGKKEILEKMNPFLGGGEMIKEVTYEKTTFNDLPFKFEAGTPNIADVIAFKYAIDYLNSFNKKELAAYEHELLIYATQKLTSIPGLKIIGEAKEKIAIISFIIDGIHHFDVGILLDQEGIAVRTGHHCTQPLMQRFHISGTTRASFAFYNTKKEIDKFVDTLYSVIKKLR